MFSFFCVAAEDVVWAFWPITSKDTNSKHFDSYWIKKPIHDINKHVGVTKHTSLSRRRFFFCVNKTFLNFAALRMKRYYYVLCRALSFCNRVDLAEQVRRAWLELLDYPWVFEDMIRPKETSSDTASRQSETEGPWWSGFIKRFDRGWMSKAGVSSFLHFRMARVRNDIFATLFSVMIVPLSTRFLTPNFRMIAWFSVTLALIKQRSPLSTT